MMFNLDLMQALMLLGSLVTAGSAALWAVGKLLLHQTERRLDEKFGRLEVMAANNTQEWQRVERELLQLKVELPNSYVRRDDWLRSQSIIEAKLDGLAVKIENAMLKGDRNG